MAKRIFDESMNDHVQISKQPKFLHNNNLLEEGVLQFDFMTSLQNMAMAKIITNLYMNKTIQQDIVNSRRKKWRKIERTVISKVFELSLPNSITKRLESIVPTVAKSILDWISYHDEQVFSCNEYSEYSTKDMISNIAWTARGRIDYTQSAKNILADQNCYLSDDHKYKLVCTYCLEDDISVLASKVVNMDYLDRINYYKHPMVYFWTKRTLGEDHFEDIDPLNRNRSINVHILRLLFQNLDGTKRKLNEVPIKYMWNKLNDEEKARNIIVLIKNLSNQDLGYTLISSLNYEQQQEVFKECSDIILEGIFNDWLRKEYFLPTAIHLLDIMNPSSYLNLLKMINEEKNKNYHEEGIYDQNKSIFKQLWQKGSSYLKDFIFDYGNGWPFCKLVTCSLSWERDMDIIGLIFNDLDTQQKRNLIFKKHGLRYCCNLILADKWCLLEAFIKHTLSSETDIDLLKEMLVKHNEHQLAVSFLEQGALCGLEHFMSWALKTEESINHFRLNLAHTKSQAIVESITDRDKADFTELESHFKWCAKDDVEVLNQLKTEFFTLYSSKLIMKLIIVDKYELLDQVFNWCFLDNLHKIEKIKSNLYKTDPNLTRRIRSFTFSLIKKDNSFKMLNKFIGWLFTKEEDIREFKKWFLCPTEGKCSLITDFFIDKWALLLDEFHFNLADKFIYWCVSDSEAAYTFKNSYMLSTDMVEFIKYGCCNTQDDLKLLIKWFNPSKETVQKFKVLFLEKDCPDNFYKLLDNFIESQCQDFSIADF